MNAAPGSPAGWRGSGFPGAPLNKAAGRERFGRIGAAGAVPKIAQDCANDRAKLHGRDQATVSGRRRFGGGKHASPLGDDQRAFNHRVIGNDMDIASTLGRRDGE